ncbi:MAG: DUF4037 domain-containing protein [Anaerolineae bacterium]
MADEDSGIDLYVYLNAELSLIDRNEVAWDSAAYAEVGNAFFESGDEWIDAFTGFHVDVTFRKMAWIEERLDRVLVRHEAALGYTTCLWHNVLSSEALHDPNEWFVSLQAETRQPYAEALRQAIVRLNHPILRQSASSYMYQLERALGREDWVSVNHRIAAMLASYFDILFAVNRMPHPGEKRLLQIASTLCERVPPDMQRDIEALICAIAEGKLVAERAEQLIDGLDSLLRGEGLIR